MFEEFQKLEDAVTDFSTAMLDKLKQKHDDGWSGYDVPRFIESGECEAMLFDHVRRLCHGQPQEIDIANLAMFIWLYNRDIEHG